jgi:hypothetical protein
VRPSVEADKWLRDNQPFPLEMVLAGFGLKLSNWEEMGKTPAPGTPTAIVAKRVIF